jgi:hypothetical protein
MDSFGHIFTRCVDSKIFVPPSKLVYIHGGVAKVRHQIWTLLLEGFKSPILDGQIISNEFQGKIYHEPKPCRSQGL